MTFIHFLIEVTIISLSGVMAPGPITAMTLHKGSKSPHAGALVAVGHGIVEIPLMLLIFYGLANILNQPYMKIAIGITGGIFLLVMGVQMFKNVLHNLNNGNTSEPYTYSPIIAGIVLSAGNPYFIIWWITIGAALIVKASEFSSTALFIFMIVHWLCDLIWLYILSFLSFKGTNLFGKKFYNILFIICTIFLIFFGLSFVIEAVRSVYGFQ